MKRNPAQWAKVRGEVLERDNLTCQGNEFGYRHQCAGSLHVHHMRRRSQGGTDTLDNLITLCRVAHDFAHANPVAGYKLGLLKRSGVA